MSLTIDEVTKIAQLARIELDEAEKAATLDKLNGIFDLIARMQAVDTTGVEPLFHPQDAAQRLRADVVSEGNRREAYQAVAPQAEDGLYLVPQVIES